jgi:16S rRNA (guanine(966)-N(2))-methyltransferase RsmD
MIRIQSGSARGRMIRTVKGLEVRPILARIRKSLFDILRPRLEGAALLDLFAGNGTVGMEALSNGARRAVFVDADRQSLRMIQRNVDDLGFSDRAEVRLGDATKDLRWLGGPFDVIFLGPPYKDASKKPLALTVPTLARIAEAGLAVPDTVVVAQHQEKESLAGLSSGWRIVRQNPYGDSRLTFFRLQE